jgi:hypothetical protein
MQVIGRNAMQVIGRNEKVEGSFGDSFSRGMQKLINIHLQDVAQRHQRTELSDILSKSGYSPEDSQLISMFDSKPEVQFKLMQILKPQPAQAKQEGDQLSQILGQFAPSVQQSMQQAPQQQQDPYGLSQAIAQATQQQPQQQPQALPGGLEKILAPYNPMDQLVSQQLGNQSRMQQPLAKPVAHENLPIPEIAGPVGPKARPEKIVPKEAPARKTAAERITNTEGLTPAQQLQREKMLVHQKEHEDVETREKFKFSKKYKEDISSKAAAARENNMRLDRMKTLNNKDQLMHPLLYTGLKGVGLDIEALQNPDTIEFNKLTNDFQKNARAIFGSRVTNFELAQFMRTIPTLSQTKEGRDRIIRNLKLFNKAVLVTKEAMDDILKEHNNVPPYDLDTLVDRRIGSQLEKISHQFSSGAKEADFKSIREASPELYKGKTGTDHATGKKYMSDGTKWLEVLQ